MRCVYLQDFVLQPGMGSFTITIDHKFEKNYLKGNMGNMSFKGDFFFDMWCWTLITEVLLDDESNIESLKSVNKNVETVT